MYICMCTWMYVSMYVFVYVQVCVCTSVCMYKCVYVCTTVRMYKCVYVQVYVCISVCMYVLPCSLLRMSPAANWHSALTAKQLLGLSAATGKPSSEFTICNKITSFTKCQTFFIFDCLCHSYEKMLLKVYWSILSWSCANNVETTQSI